MDQLDVSLEMLDKKGDNIILQTQVLILDIEVQFSFEQREVGYDGYPISNTSLSTSNLEFMDMDVYISANADFTSFVIDADIELKFRLDWIRKH